MDPSTTSTGLIKGSDARTVIQVTITVLGVVQGVGMRPFVARLAGQLGIAGSVRNAGANLIIEATGSPLQIDRLLSGLGDEAPPAARIVRVSVAESQPADGANCSGWQTGLSQPDFRIAESQPASGLVLISPDLAICPACARELLDPANRRFDHALISCMHCGPRYAILEDLPYDRPRTTLRDFPLCPACQVEYGHRENRRHHAQTISCPDCGPQLSFDGGISAESRNPGSSRGNAALEQAVRILQGEGIIAVKGIGGYHLACRPDSGSALQRLRRIKNREAKPFAVLFPDLAILQKLAVLSQAEINQLQSPARPIVLVWPRQDPAAPMQGERVPIDRPVHPLVSGSSLLLGAFLPATPLQVQLARRLGPLVMTSANLSGDVICIEDREMQAFAAAAGLDGVLSHDRRITVHLDDSVMRLAEGQPLLIRRARGYVPLPIDLAGIGTGLLRIAAAGGDLKATAALTRDNLCYLGAPVGDLSEVAVTMAWQRQVGHLRRLLDLEPDWLVADRHPDYQSIQLLRGQFPDRPLLTVQHHRAHIASVLAENPGHYAVIGVAMDGTGYGDDGSVWGGEWLTCHGETMTRTACLRPIPFSGGDQGRKRAWQCLVNYLAAAGTSGERLLAAIPCLLSRAGQAAVVFAACRQQVGTVPSSSTGSLFDAVSALLGFGEVNAYEGQCAQALEQAAMEATALDLPAWPLPELMQITDRNDDQKDLIQLDPSPLFPILADAITAGADPRSLARAFHEELAGKISLICQAISRETAIRVVALGGGCFQNVLLLEKTSALLRQAGFQVLTNRQVPPGDGGLALGQTWLALRLIAAQSINPNQEE